MRIDPSQLFDHTRFFPTQARTTFQIVTPPLWVEQLDQQAIFTTSEKSDIRRMFDERGPLRTGLNAHIQTIAPQQVGTTTHAFYGPPRKHPHTILYSDLEISFLLMGQHIDDARALRRCFVCWQEYMAGRRDTAIPRSDTTAYAVEYYDNFVSEVEVLNYDSGLVERPLIRTRFSEVFPISVGGLQTSWSSPNDPMSMSVTFAFFASTILE